MSLSLSAQRDLIQQQVQELEQSLSVTNTELELLSSETDESSDDDDESDEDTQSVADLLAQRDKIQKDIQNLENVLGPHGPACVSDADSSSSSDESDLGLSFTVESCLQMNLVYQQVLQEALDKLEVFLTQNEKEQKEVETQLSGPIKEPPREKCPASSYQLPVNMFLGRFLKPYFKDKLTGLGPPANQESKEKASRMTGCQDNKKVKRWESWQKTLLIHSVSRDGLRRLIQPKLSKVDYLSQKLSSAVGSEKQQLREQIDVLEREIELLREKKEEELIGDRYEELDWQKISNIDFEGTRNAEDLRCFWQNFLHPSINKSGWSQEEVHTLKQLSRKYEERHWESIAAELGTGRTGFMCLQTYQRFASDSLKRCNWTTAEDSLLKELVEKMRIGNFIPYTQISYFMESRDPNQLMYRWNNVLDPRLKKGPWTAEEDQLLLRAVARYGEKYWWKIRMEVPGRHDGACRDRYIGCLKEGTKRGPFDKKEIELLQKLVEKHGVGRWAKMAAEIPHRTDAQCLREWKKLSRPPQCPAQVKQKPAKRKRQRREAAAQRIRKRVIKLEREEEEDMIVEYMDSDEEVKKKKKRRNPNQSSTVEVEKEVVEEEKEEVSYSFPPLQDWLPAENPPVLTLLRFRPAEFPSSHQTQVKKVRSTVLGKYGRSVMIAAPPLELPLEKLFSASTLLVTSDQLQAHLSHQADRFRPAVKIPAGTVGRATRWRMEYELKAAVTPWVGNLIIPCRSTVTTATKLREQGQKKLLSSTPLFMLFLQTMNVDFVGCTEMIKRKSEVISPAPPHLPPHLKDPKTLAGMLHRRRQKQELQVQQSVNQKQVQRKLLLHPIPHHQVIRAVPPQASSRENHTGTLHTPSQMKPLSVPRAVFIPQTSVGPFQVLRPTSIGPSSSSPNDMAFPVPVPSRPGSALSDGEVSPRVSAGPGLPSVVSSCVSPPSVSPNVLPACPDSSLSPAQERVAPPGPTPPPAASSVEAALHIYTDHDYTPHLPTAPTWSFDSNPRKIPKAPSRTRKQQGEAGPNATSSSGQHGAQKRPWVGDPTSAGEGKRLRKPSQRARAFQEAAKAKEETKKKTSLKKRPAKVLLPGPERAGPVWLLAPAALVNQAPPLGRPLTLVRPAPTDPQPLCLKVALPLDPCTPTSLPSWFTLQPVQTSSAPLVFSQPKRVLLPSTGRVLGDVGGQPPLHRDKLNFDPSLIFLESHGAVGDWLGLGRQPLVPGAGGALPYLPPFVSSLSSLSALLRAKNSLTKCSLRLLSQGLEPRTSRARPKAHSHSSQSTAQPPGCSSHPPSGPSMSTHLQQGDQEEAGLVATIRQLVAERFSTNPTYQLLKARFLSCFTVPALMASIQPVTKTTVEQQTSRDGEQEEEEEEEEEEDEEEQQLKKTCTTGKEGRAERSSLRLEESGAPASHYSGMTHHPSDPDLPPSPQ